MSTLPTVKKGRVTRVTKVHEERDLVRVERDDGSGPVAEVLDHRQIRSSVAPARRKSKGKILATLPSSETETAAGPGGETSDVLDSQEAEELLSEAEKLLRQPVQGGTRHVTAEHSTQAGPSQQLELGSADDAVPDSQHHIEEVHPDTAEDGQQAEFEVEEPESSMAALSGSSGLLEARKHGAAAKGDATSKAQSPDKDTTRAATRASKQAEKGKAVAAAPGASPKGKAAAKRAAEPVSQAEKSPKKVAKRSSDEPATPAKAPPAPAGSLKQPTSDQRPGPSVTGKHRKATGKSTKRKKRSVETYKTYIYRVLKEVHPDVGISKQGMQVMQTFAVDMFDRIMVEASRLCRIGSKATLSSREIQTAVRLLMPGELSRHAVTEGTKAVTKATKDA